MRLPVPTPDYVRAGCEGAGCEEGAVHGISGMECAGVVLAVHTVQALYMVVAGYGSQVMRSWLRPTFLFAPDVDGYLTRLSNRTLTDAKHPSTLILHLPTWLVALGSAPASSSSVNAGRRRQAMDTCSAVWPSWGADGGPWLANRAPEVNSNYHNRRPDGLRGSSRER